MTNTTESALITDSIMHNLDMDNWERSEHFTFFQSMKSCQYGFTIQQDITEVCELRKRIKSSAKSIRFSDALYFFATKAANTVPELRTRIVDGKPVIFDKIHPAFTYIPKGRSLHANCLAQYADNYAKLTENIEFSRQNADKNPSLTPKGGDKQNLLYFSINNGVAFTSATNPWGDCNEDSVPRILFGQVTKNAEDKKILPVSIELLHSLADGRHIAEFFKLFGEMCSNPEKYINV
ncbi:chloramphenicol O-acetyltransferase type A [Maridesulfovibrio ferrireducens]|uniref:Chloramphenicol O-acetyltransferase type A n=1 Tax=Maridesulfovibrio ferrireducens TaxID=246191 RepID=A0A1G9E9X1_9BACT|nr:CatA-like O-acetyltransferase [Maridesulfovibrio ferrireducens]SDK72901.1 chloramphenicol O-acetyltransferase type A [Maridesulfovibrio ferrireducens]